jgi:hypothetical protein
MGPQNAEILAILLGAKNMEDTDGKYTRRVESKISILKAA